MKADSPVVTYVYESDDYGGSHSPNIGVLHDVECPLQAGYAKSLIGPNWFAGPATTSTHYIVDPVDICQGVPENRIAWHCGTGNRGTIAIEQAGYARFSRAEWTTPDGLKQRTNVAKLMADINKRRSNIRLKWLSDNELRSAFNNGGPGGWATHDQMRRVIGGTTHYDPMNAPDADHAYPLTELMNEAIAIRGGAPVDKDWFDMATEEDLRRIVREETKGIAENAAEARRLAAVAAGIRSQAVGDEKTPADAIFAKTLTDSTGKGNSFEAFVVDGNARIVRIDERTAAPKA